MTLMNVPKAQPRCPICKTPAADAYRPFCSARCANVDLARWLKGAYAVAGDATDGDEDGDDAAAGRQALPTPPAEDDTGRS